MTYAPPPRAFPTGVYHPAESPMRVSMPFGVLLLCLTSVVIGFSSLTMSVIGIFDDSEGTTIHDLDKMLDEALASAPPDARQKIEAFRKDKKSRKLMEHVLGEVRTISPYPTIYGTLELLMSLGLLIGGAGLFLRRDWGRKTLMGIILGGTLLLGGYVYLMIPGLLRVLRLVSEFTAMKLDPQIWSSRFYDGWTGIFLILIGLHTLIVFYLSGTSVTRFTDSSSHHS